MFYIYGTYFIFFSVVCLLSNIVDNPGISLRKTVEIRNTTITSI